METTQTISAMEFKGKCLNILDRLPRHELERVIITKRGQAVGVSMPADRRERDVRKPCGSMRGSIIVADGVDLTEPVRDEPFDAELGGDRLDSHPVTGRTTCSYWECGCSRKKRSISLVASGPRGSV